MTDHIWGVIWGLSEPYLGTYLSHIWGFIWGLSELYLWFI